MGKKIDQLDVYDDINIDKSKRDLFEVSKNTGTYASPTYETDGSRKISVEQLKETLNIKDYLFRDFVAIGSGGTIVEDKVNAIIVSADTSFTLPTADSSNYGKSLVVVNRSTYTVTVNGIVNGTSIKLTNFNETIQLSCLFDGVSTYGWWLISDAITDKICSNLVTLIASTYVANPNDSIRARPQINSTNINITINSGVEGQCIYIKNQSVALGNTYTVNLIGYYSHSLSAEEWVLIRYFGAEWEVIATNQNVAVTPTLDEVTDVGNTTTNSIEVGGLVVDMPSGSGVAVNITKGGNEEGLKVHKTSGSGNVASFTGGATLISQLDLTTPLADSEIASASTWNGKFNTPTGLTTNNVSKWNGTGFVDSLLQSRNGLTIQNGTIIDCNTDAKSFFEFYPLIKNTVGTGRFAFNFFPESDTNNTGFLNIIGITSGGDTVTGKKTLSSAIVINHQSTLQNNAAISIVAKTSGNSIWFPSDTTRGVIDVETNGDAFVARLTGSQGTQTRTSGFVAIINESAFAFSFKQKRTTTTGTLTEHARSMSTISSAVSNGWGTVSRHFLDVTGISNSFDIETKLINSTTGETAYTFRQTQWGGGSAGTKVIASFQGEGVVIGGESRTASAQLDLQATNKGFLPNRMTNAQRTAISSPAIGLMVYCTDATEGLYIYKSTGWTFII